jgi:nucleoside-diphosphate-sugar epimerase
MTVLEQKPLTLPIPLREDPPGVFRVGKSRVLLELVIRAHQRGKSPLEIVQMYDALHVGDVYAVIAYYLAHPAEVDAYLRRCDEEAEATRRKIEATQKPGPTKEELLARDKSRKIEQPPLVTEEDEAALDRAWERIRREDEAKKAKAQGLDL